MPRRRYDCRAGSRSAASGSSSTPAWDIRLGYGGVGIAELAIPGVRAERTLLLPDAGAEASGARRRRGDRRGGCRYTRRWCGSCRPAGPRPRRLGVVGPSAADGGARRGACGAGLLLRRGAGPLLARRVPRVRGHGNVLDRTLRLPVAAPYTVEVRARPRAGPKLSAAIDSALAADAPTVTASSVAIVEPAARPGAVVDGDPGTRAWHAADEDRAPWLRLVWPSTRTIDMLRFHLADGVAAAQPWSVTALGDGGVATGTVDAGGLLSFDHPSRTQHLTLLFTDPDTAGSVRAVHRPVRGAAARGGGVDRAAGGCTAGCGSDTELRLPCGSGPTVDGGGRRLRTAVTATVRELVERREVVAKACGAVPPARLDLPAGRSRVVATGTPYAEPSPADAGPRAPGGGAGPRRGEQCRARRSTGRRPCAAGYGWPGGRSSGSWCCGRTPTPGGGPRSGAEPLRPVVVDGWQQGWIVPPGPAATVAIRFAPDGAYRAGLVVGALLLFGVAAAAALPTRSPGRRSRPRVRPDAMRPVRDGIGRRRSSVAWRC